MIGGERFVAREVGAAGPVEIAIEGGTIVSVAPIADPGGVPWIAPAFWDIQMNGRWGWSFSDPSLSVDQVSAIIRAQAGLGTARVCPTLITAPFAAMRHGLRTIAEACEMHPDVGRMVAGVHLEGPSISEVDGYRGAHPRADVRGPDWDEFQALQAASGGRVVLVTLAPERLRAIGFIRRAVASGVVVALGHTAADSETIAEAVDAGATLSTHLGNGIAATLARHPNPIWSQAADDRLRASFIADGEHLGREVLAVLLRAKASRALLVSDASPLAGLPPGEYGAWSVDEGGAIRVTGTPYLAGAGAGLEAGINLAWSILGGPLAPVLAMATSEPARALGREPGRVAAGEPANLIRFVADGPGSFRLVDTCVDGAWTPSDVGPIAR